MAKRLTAVLATGALAVSGGAVALLPAHAQPSPSQQLDVHVGYAGEVNLAGPGLVPVTVYGSDTLDVTDLDVETLRLGDGVSAGATPARWDDGSPVASALDANGNGSDDLVVHFDKDDLARDGGLAPDTEELTLSARVAGGGDVNGSGTVRPEIVLEVKFDESLEVRGADEGLRSQRGRSMQRVESALERYAAYDLTPFVQGAAAERLEEAAAEAHSRTGEPVPDMASWYVLRLPADTDVDAVLAELRALPEIVHADPAPNPAPPPSPAPVQVAEPTPPVPRTPDFIGMQRYFRSAAENGIDADFSRADPRLRGAGIKIVDFEYDWNEDHEDLQLPNPGTELGGAQFAKYKGFNDQHGTAVMGILGAIDNKYGVTGGVPDAELYGLSPSRNNPQQSYAAGASLAYLAALQGEQGNPFLQPGDAVLLEQQGGQVIPDSDCPVRPGTCYSPLEWNAAVHEAVTLLSSMGVNVVATGGNGYNSTDHPAYTRDGQPWFRPENHSGSIFVGAGNSSTRERLSYSNHGPRFDLQGWGQGITTTGHGGMSTSFWPTTGGDDPATLNFRYTSSFGGTSGAGPIVTTAVVAIQSYLRATGQEPWSAQEIADVLKATGQPQGPNTAAQHIGALPNLEAALKQIEVDAPETTLTLNGRPQRPGSYVNPVVMLKADDGWGSGVERIEYRIDDGEWTTYDGRFRVVGQGVRTVYFRAVDVNGNVAEVEAVAFMNRGRGTGGDEAS